jgi:serine/threonine-protein kinase BUR1
LELLQKRPCLDGDPYLAQKAWSSHQNQPHYRSVSESTRNTSIQNKNLCLPFARYGSGAISLLNELLKLDWRKRVNAIDALKHPYFRNDPLPAKPGDLPTFEESHELDRRKFRGQKAAPPPAPKGGDVGRGPNGGQPGWGGEPAGNGNPGFGNGDGYQGYRHQNGSRYYPPPPPPHGGHRNGVQPPPSMEERRPAWRRDDRPDTRLPPRPPAPVDFPPMSYDGGRSDRPDGYRSRSRDLERDRAPPRSRGSAPNVDTYIPSYGPDSVRPPRDDRPPREDRPPRDDRAPRDDRPRDDRRWRDVENHRDDRRHDRDRDRDRDRLDYGDDRSRSTRTRSRSRSPIRERDRERIREREPLDRERDRERDNRDIYRR